MFKDITSDQFLKCAFAVSCITHLLTFILLGLGSIYHNAYLTGGSLLSLMIGLLFVSLALYELDSFKVKEKAKEVPDYASDVHLAEIREDKR